MKKNTKKILVYFLLIFVALLIINSFVYIKAETTDGNNQTNQTNQTPVKECINRTLYENYTSMTSEEIECERNYFKEELNISEDKNLENETIQKLIEAKISDNDNLQKVINITNSAETEDKEKTIFEILFIKKDFIEKFYNYSVENEKNLNDSKIQINNYIGSVIKKENTNEKIKINLNEEKIKKLFNDKDSDNFIQSILPFS